MPKSLVHAANILARLSCQKVRNSRITFRKKSATERRRGKKRKKERKKDKEGDLAMRGILKLFPACRRLQGFSYGSDSSHNVLQGSDEEENEKAIEQKEV